MRRLLISPLTMICVLLCFTLASLWSLIFWKGSQDKAHAFARAGAETQGLTHSLAQHASKSFGAVALALFGIKQYVEHSQKSAQNLGDINDLLSQFSNNLPQVRELGILSASGSWMYSSFKTIPPHNNADREYFKYHQANSDNTVRLNEPLVSRVTGRPTLLLTQRLSNADGSFAGVVFAAVDLKYFRLFYRSFEVGQNRTVTLLLTNGTVLVHQSDEEVGKDLSKTPLFVRHVLNSTTGMYPIVSPFDGLEKQFAYEVSPDFPVIVTVALAENQILRTWTDDRRFDIALGLGISSVLIFLAIVLWLQSRHRSHMARLLREREHGYRLLAENVEDVVTRINSDGQRLYISPSVEKLLGWKAHEILSQSAFENIHPSHREIVKRLILNLCPQKPTAICEYMARTKVGKYVWLEAQLNFIVDENNPSSEIVAVIRDISKRKAIEEALTTANDQLTALSETNSLTGIANRRKFDAVFDQERRRALRAKSDLSVILIDIDWFKLFNDTYGHSCGDNCLRNVAQALAMTVKRPGDLVARYGGEEFAVILPETDLESALLVAELLRDAVCQLSIEHSKNAYGIVTISIGVAGIAGDESSDGADLLIEADRALYRAKETGRNRVCSAIDQIEAIQMLGRRRF